MLVPVRLQTSEYHKGASYFSLRWPRTTERMENVTVTKPNDESPQTECEGNEEFDNEKNEQSSMRGFWDLTARAFTAVKVRSRNEKNTSGNNQEDGGAND